MKQHNGHVPGDHDDEMKIVSWAGYMSVYILNKKPEESESSHNAIEYSHAVAHMKGVASHLPANQTHRDNTLIVHYSRNLYRTGAQCTLWGEKERTHPRK